LRILALETTDKAGSLAVLDGSKVLANMQLDASGRSAQSLVPGIREVLNSVGWTMSDVELLAVAIGPGSFTGLRVGVTTAKTLAYATGAAVIGVNTLEVIAAQADRPVARLHAILDAQRGELFAGLFDASQSREPRWLTPEAIIAADDWLASLQTGDVVSGPATAKIASRLPAGVTALPPEQWSPLAATIGHLAAQAAATGRRDDLWKITPHYLRASAAEEKLARSPSA